MAIDEIWRLRREILAALRDCSGVLMPEPALLAHAQMVCAPTPTVTEFHEALEALEGQRYLVRVRPQGDLGPLKCGITDAGRALLAAG